MLTENKLLQGGAIYRKYVKGEIIFSEGFGYCAGRKISFDTIRGPESMAWKHDFEQELLIVCSDILDVIKAKLYEF